MPFFYILSMFKYNAKFPLFDRTNSDYKNLVWNYNNSVLTMETKYDKITKLESV